MIWGILGGSLLFLGLTGAVLGCVLGGTGMLMLHFLVGNGAIVLAAETLWNDLTKYTLASVLIFIIVGDLFFASGLASRSYRALSPLFARIPGRLLHTNVALCMLFGAVSGTSTATAAAVGATAYPELTARGYDRSAILGSLAGAGTLGLLIPPSIALILYGVMQDVSISRLFLAGVIPSLLLGLCFMVFIVALALYRSDIAPADSYDRPSCREVLRSLTGLWPLVLLMTTILGPLYAGLATPTESASFGVVIILVLGIFGSLTPKRLIESFLSTMIKFGAIIFVVMGAMILKQAIGILNVPHIVINSLTDLLPGKYETLLAVIIFFIVLGCLFDGISLLLLATPFTAPLLLSHGFDAVWIGVLITLLIEIGMITPPVGPNLFVLSSITNQRVGVGEIARSAVPYFFILLGGIGALIIFPQLALWLPTLVFG